MVAIGWWFQSRELQITVYWKDYRQMCAVKFLRLEDFLDDRRQGMAVQLEPQGILFVEVRCGVCMRACMRAYT